MIEKRILVVDDSHYDLIIASEMITDVFPNVDVVCVNSAIKGLELLENASIDELPELILLDIKMPKMDGFEFLNHYGRLPTHIHERCSICMLSSSIDPSDIFRAKRSPFVVDYIEKPLSDETINSLISTIEQK